MKIYMDGELFKGDRNRLVYIETGPNDPEITYVQFYNKKSQFSKEIQVYDNVAKIPNELIKEGLPIIAIACTGTIGRTSPICREVFDVLKDGSFSYEQKEELVIYDGGEEV